MRRLRILIASWAVLLVAGFAVVFLLGGPVRTAAEELDAALHPSPPVTQEAAEQVADTLVRLQYPAFRGVPRSVTRASDFGLEHWVLEYSDRSGAAPRGLRISVVLQTGQVEVNTFP